MTRWGKHKKFNNQGESIRPFVVCIVTLIFFSATIATMGAIVVAESGEQNGQPSPTERWNRTYGGADHDEITAIARTDSGYILAGSTWSFGAGEADAWLVKVDENGTEQWNRTYGTDDNERVHAMIRTPDNGLLLVGSSGGLALPSDGWVLKADVDGNELWNRTYGDVGADRFHSVLLTSDGDYVLAGLVERNTVGVPDAWLVKIGADGEETWNQTYGGVGFDAANSVVRTEDGYAFAGYTRPANETQFHRWLVVVNEAGVEEWNKTYESFSNPFLAALAPLSLVRTEDGFMLGGSDVTTEAESDLDAWVMRVGKDGNHQWTRTYEVVGDDFLTTMTTAPDGGVVVAGEGVDVSGPSSEQHSDAWAMKLTADGREQWTRTYGNTGEEAFLTVRNVDDGYLIGGYTTSFRPGESAGFVVRLDTD